MSTKPYRFADEDAATGLAFKDPGTIRVMPSNRLINPLTMGPEDVRIEEVAHGLARMCRYGGHIRPPLPQAETYNVAQHSIIVCNVLKLQGFGLSIQLAGLLHDGEEGLGMMDIPKPIKSNPMLSKYVLACDRLREVIFQAFGLHYSLYNVDVKRVDHEVYLMERRAFWDGNHEIVALGPRVSEEKFLSKFKDLHGAIHDHNLLSRQPVSC